MSWFTYILQAHLLQCVVDEVAIEEVQIVDLTRLPREEVVLEDLHRESPDRKRGGVKGNVCLSQSFYLCSTKLNLTLCILETPEQVLLQTVKIQMKCSIMLHFIRVFTVCKGKKDLQTKEYNIFVKIITDTPRYVHWTISSSLYQTSRKNPLVYKGLSSS